MVSAIDFMTENTFNFMPIEKKLVAMKTESKDYDFKSATEKSRLTATVFYTWSPPTRTRELFGFSRFFASGKNCDYLKDIIQEYLMPNML